MFARVPVFEQRVDNIMGIAYAMDLLDYVQKVGSFYSLCFFDLQVLYLWIVSPDLIVAEL